MTHSLLHERFLARKAALAALLDRLADLAGDTGSAALSELAQTLAATCNDPFLFVVLGEVKTGKSSLINALLGEEVCPVAPDPCTDRIQIVAHGPSRARTDESPFLARIFLPHDILRDIAIVDTPGVDSVIDRHQEITEDFLPRCDLAIFVFSAINPYSRSAWDFFDLVKGEWRRKIVFVLNQADLADPEQLAVNARSVRELAAVRGAPDPLVFAVSSRISRTDPERGGVEALRRHIREMVTGGAHYADKLLSVIEAARRALARTAEGLAAQEAALDGDRAEAGRIRERLESARRAADREAERLTERAVSAYARLCAGFVEDLEAELTLGAMLSRSARSLFRRGKDRALGERATQLADAFRDNLRAELDVAAREGAVYTAESLSDRLRPLVDELARAAGAGDPGTGAGKIDLTALSRQREKVLAEVAAGAARLLEDERPLASLSPKELAGLDPRAAMGGVLTLAGAAFALAVKSVLIDVTGGVLAGAGVFLLGGALAWRRPKLVRAVKKDLAAGGYRLECDLKERLAARLDRVFEELGECFAPYFDHLEKRARELAALAGRREDLEAAFDEQAREIGARERAAS